MNGAAPGAELVVDGLTVRFGGLTAVESLSFEVKPGEVLSLIGPNGAGKTTAFNAITGYIAPDGGAIAYRGTRIDGLKPNEIAERGIVRTFQKTSVFMGQSVLDNVLLGLHLTSKQTPLAIVLGLPWVAREERVLAEEARRILGFVDLDVRACDLASATGTLPPLDVVGAGPRIPFVTRAVSGERHETPRAILLDLFDDPDRLCSRHWADLQHEIAGRMRRVHGVGGGPEGADFVVGEVSLARVFLRGFRKAHHRRHVDDFAVHGEREDP